MIHWVDTVKRGKINYAEEGEENDEEVVVEQFILDLNGLFELFKVEKSTHFPSKKARTTERLCDIRNSDVRHMIDALKKVTIAAAKLIYPKDPQELVAKSFSSDQNSKDYGILMAKKTM